MQLFSLGQGTVSPWSIVARCPRVLQVSQVSQSQLPDIVGNPCNTLGQRATMLHGDTVPCPKEKSCIVWTDFNGHKFPVSFKVTRIYDTRDAWAKTSRLVQLSN